MDAINLLCAADLHLGRQVGEGSYVIKAWENLIECCLSSKPPIDGLLLAGDVIDGDDLFIEMYGVLRRGIRRLLEKGIQVIAVAGNHDPEVLRQISSSLDLPGFHLLGKEGNWERVTCLFKGRAVHIDGRSFTSAFFEGNPLDSYHLERPPEGEPLIGLLHCDVDGAKSRYAPLPSTTFQRMPHAVWILGHLHVPRLISARPLVRYTGSLQGLDVSEVGAHGALLLKIHLDGMVEAQEHPLAPLRWEHLNIDMSDLSSSDWAGEILQKIEGELLASIQGEESHVELLGVRLVLEGRTPLFREIRRNLFRIRDQEMSGVSVNGKWIPYFLESIHNLTRPSYDLKRLSEGSDLVAALARQLINYSEAEVASYLEERFRKDAALRHGEEAWLTEKESCELYLSKGFELLDELLRQKQEALCN